MFKITRLGDSCTHGAVVITADNNRLVDGIPVARIGDLVSCPIPGHGVNPIVATTASIVVTDGKTTSRLHSICACGAVVITGSTLTHIDH